MKIYTSYFAQLDKLPTNIVPISICAKAPDFYTGLQYKVLAPSYDLLQHWHKNHDIKYYNTIFDAEILFWLTRCGVVHDLEILSRGKDVALICYEKPFEFCHRHLVAKWLGDVEEYKF